MFKRAVLSGEGGRRKWVCAGLQVFSGVCHVYFLLLGGKLPMILLFYSSACLKSFITNEVGPEGEPGLLFAGDGGWGWREMSQKRRAHGFSPPSTVWSNTFQGNESVCGTAPDGSAENKILEIIWPLSGSEWVTCSEPYLSQVPSLSWGSSPSSQSLAAFGCGSHPWKPCRAALQCGGRREWAYKYWTELG